MISAAVEGPTDEALVRRLIAESGGFTGQVYGKNGKAALRSRIGGYIHAARHSPWIIVVDLDREAACAPELRRSWVSVDEPKLCFRVAVRAIEAWLLADQESVATFLSVPLSRVPSNPESADNPKQVMINLAAQSRRREIREDMVPRARSGRREGPAYSSRLIEFINSGNVRWRPRIAAKHSDSLRRSMECLSKLIEGERTK